MMESSSFVEQFFLLGSIPVNAETGHYVPYLVALSYFIAALGSLIGLRIADDLYREQKVFTQYLYHFLGAMVIGASIWSMHFIGMLAYDMDMKVIYDRFLIGISFGLFL